jgi:hypothetical protein
MSHVKIAVLSAIAVQPKPFLCSVFFIEGLAGWPGEGATRQKVDVQVGHGLAGILSVVDDEAEALGALVDAELLGGMTRGEEQGTELGLIFGGGFADAWDGLFRHDEEVNGGLGTDVAEGEAVRIFEDDVGRDLAGDDFFKEGLAGAHGWGRSVWLFAEKLLLAGLAEASIAE